MKQNRAAIFGLDIILGLIFVLFNFGRFVRYSAEEWVANPTISNGIISMTRWPEQAVPLSGPASHTMLHDLLVLCFYGVWLYLGLVILLALLRRDIKVAANGVAGTAAGFFGLSFLAWLGVALVAIGGVLIAMLPFLAIIWRFLVSIWDFLAGILSTIWSYLAPIFAFLGPFIMAFVALAFLVWVIVMLYRGMGLKGILLLLLLGGAAYMGRSILLPILNLLWGILSIIFAFLGKILAWLYANLIPIAILFIIVGTILTIVGSLGAFIVDQVRSAWHSGTGHRGVLLGSFSIGLAIALIVWAASATPPAAAAVDAAWRDAVPVLDNVELTQVLNATMPAAAQDATRTYLANSDAPNFDALILVIVLLTAVLGVTRGILRRNEDGFKVTFFHQDILKVGAMLALVIPSVMLILLARVPVGDD